MTATADAVLAQLRIAGEEAAAAADVEAALRCLTHGVQPLVGDPDAHLRPGGLKPGERQFSVAGAFIITPDRAYNMLVANFGFPPDQRRLSIPIALGHPGEIVRTERPLLLANTDEHDTFRQYLKTSRMGSAIFAPFFWHGTMIGHLIVASQARYTYGQADLDILRAFAGLAGPLWIAHGGPEFLAHAYPPDPAEAGFPKQEQD
jgi:hypothetical protein